jgi:hypothetical protein
MYMMLVTGCEDLTPTRTMPQTVSVSVSDIGETSAVCRIGITSKGATQKSGIVYGTDPSLQTGTSELTASGGEIDIVTLSGLNGGVTYYLRAYAADKLDARVYGDIQSFTTVLTEFGDGITAAYSFGGGDGTQNNPYLISDARHLKKLVEDTNNNGMSSRAYFKLTIDIRITASEWIPIGSLTPPFHHSFRGAFDGGGHTISGAMRSSSYQRFGFFGSLIGSLTPLFKVSISNLNMAATIESRYDSTGISHTGSLAGGMMNGDIYSCNISGPVTGGTGSNSCTGGMIGCSEIAAGISGENTIRDCNLSGTVRGGHGNQGDSHTGGVVGIKGKYKVEISDCTVSGSVIGGDATGDSTTGGIIGWLGNTDIISGCSNHAPVAGKNSGNSQATGGLVGRNSGNIHTSLNTGNVTAPSGNIGGLVGDNNNAYVYSCCTNTGNVNDQPPSNENQIGRGSAVTPCPDGHAKR